MASILVINDDGVHAAGIAALADSLRPLGDVVVVAPDREQSAASHALTLHAPLRIREVNAREYAVDGTPADCVYLGALQILDRKPDLVVAGINHGSNIGDDVTYSGTIAAAIEGTILGIPSFAISQEAKSDAPRGSGSGRFDFGNAGVVAHEIACRILEQGLPAADILLNVNVPVDPIKGTRCTRQGRRTYDEVVHEGTDPRGRLYYWIGSGAAPHIEQDPDTDYMAVRGGCISICPLHLDLTHYPSLELMEERWGDVAAAMEAALGA
ncbi:MAG: 5'/3'-nucleotidase SurE [Acidobacteria bacterium]|nr:5'/3'-nucleotidase SurE [Acidobacteriota bacterium]